MFCFISVGVRAALVRARARKYVCVFVFLVRACVCIRACVRPCTCVRVCECMLLVHASARARVCVCVCVCVYVRARAVRVFQAEIYNLEMGRPQQLCLRLKQHDN